MKNGGVKIQLPCTQESLISYWEEKTGETADPAARSAAQILADVINGAYLDGLDGVGGYPIDPDAEIRARATKEGVEVTDSRCRFVRKLTQWQNAAYQEGRRVAQSQAARTEDAAS